MDDWEFVYEVFLGTLLERVVFLGTEVSDCASERCKSEMRNGAWGSNVCANAHTCETQQHIASFRSLLLGFP